MTREEAIKLLVNATYSDEWQGNEDLTTAHNMAIKALETVEEFEKAHIITGGRLNGRTYAYKCGLEDGKRKALEQEPCEDAVSRQALYEALYEHFHDEDRKEEVMTREEKTNLINELLEYEENNDIGNLTRAERREFQQWISKALEQDTDKEKVIEELQESLQKANATNSTLIQLIEGKQEPCEDAISRNAVLNIVCQYLDGDELVDKISNLPSVTPTRKKGKWVNKSQKSGCGITFVASECTCCGKKTLFNCNELIYRYCPNCGAEMESEK